MREENEHYAYFSIRGDFHPDEITRMVGTNPTKSWRAGEKTQWGWERKSSHWSLQSIFPTSRPLEVHVKDVLRQLDANPQAFKTISERFDGYMQLVGYFWLGYPGLVFDRDITEGLARYRLAVDFDFYGLYSPRREDVDV